MSVFRVVTASAVAGLLLLGTSAHAAPRYTTVAADIAGDANGVDEFGVTDNTSTGVDEATADLLGLDLSSDGRALTVRVRVSGTPSPDHDYGVQAVDDQGCDVFVQVNGTSRPPRQPFVNRVCAGQHSPAYLNLTPTFGAHDITLRIPYFLLPRGLGTGTSLHGWYFDCADSVWAASASNETVSWDHGEGNATYRLR
jgi:hypothetical protein